VVNNLRLSLKDGGLAVSSEKQGRAFPAGRYVGHKRGQYYVNASLVFFSPLHVYDARMKYGTELG
jgi:hypothetical protein